MCAGDESEDEPEQRNRKHTSSLEFSECDGGQFCEEYYEATYNETLMYTSVSAIDGYVP